MKAQNLQTFQPVTFQRERSEKQIHIRALQDVAATLGYEQGFIGERFGFFVFLLIIAQTGEVEEDIGFKLN